MAGAVIGSGFFVRADRHRLSRPSKTEGKLMPTVTIEGVEIGVAGRSIVRMADRLHRLGPVRRLIRR